MAIEQWTAIAIMKMHLHGISQRKLSKKLGVTPEYVNMVLNGKRSPEGAEEKFLSALREMIAEGED